MFICELNSIDSTNNKAKEIIQNGSYFPDNFAIFSHKQTKGVGKLNRKWYSFLGNVHLSIVLKQQRLEDINLLSLLVALAIRNVISRYISLDIKLKWVNDIYIEDAKLAGILIEIEQDKNLNYYAIIGIGINIVNSPIIEDYATTFLNNYTNDRVKALDLSMMIIEEIKSLLDNKNINIIKLWERNALYLNQNIIFQQGAKNYQGRFIGINEEGYLKLDTKEGVLIFSAGEIRCI